MGYQFFHRLVVCAFLNHFVCFVLEKKERDIGFSFPFVFVRNCLGASVNLYFNQVDFLNNNRFPY